MYSRSLIIAALISACLHHTSALGQPPRRRGGGGNASLKQPYVGIKSQGKIEKDLFRIESNGVSTQPVVDAARTLVDSLSKSQVFKIMFSVDDIEWCSWDNRHRYKRRGVGFDEMTDDQRMLAFNLMQVSLRAKGLKQFRDIMKLNGALAELANDFEEYGEWLYWITIMGDPSADQPRGWQIDGHYLVINYFVLGDQVVMSPVFVGSESVHATSGKFQGTIVMQQEQNKGLAVLLSLTPEQKKSAILSEVKQGNNALTQVYRDNANPDYVGAPVADFTEPQQILLLGLIHEYVGTMSDGHAAVKMNEVKKYLDHTWFAWIGGITDESVYYYRVHSPVVLIEFDHQRRVAPFR